ASAMKTARGIHASFLPHDRRRDRSRHDVVRTCPRRRAHRAGRRLDDGEPQGARAALRAGNRSQAHLPLRRHARADQARHLPFGLGGVPVGVRKDAAARAKCAAAAPADVARVGYGVAVRAGAPKPDVSTPDALRDALLKAQSITFYPESAAGNYVMRTFERLAI